MGKRRMRRCVFVLATVGGSLAAIVTLTLALTTQAGAGVRYVAPGGNCRGFVPCYGSVQAAVDAAVEGDVIKIAIGTYTDTHTRSAPDGYEGPSTITQVVCLCKSVTLRGGYGTTFSDPPDPQANPTTLDAGGRGRVIFAWGNISSTLEGLRITGGDAAGQRGTAWWGDSGGGAYMATTAVTWQRNKVFSNTAGEGGGLYLTGDSATLDGNVIYSNTAAIYRGGGIYMLGTRGTLTGNWITGNTAPLGGGAYIENSTGTLDDNIFSTNRGFYQGGGLYLFQSPVTLTRNTITSNTVETISSNPSLGGGGVFLHFSAAALNENVIGGNTTTRDGGGLYLEASHASLDRNWISDNTARSGGGLYLNFSPATLDKNVIQDNTASLLYSPYGYYVGRGGGALIYASEAMLDGNIIQGNATEQGGGGLALVNSPTRLSGNWIIENSSRDPTWWDRGGGGVFLEGSNSSFVNNVIADNQAGKDGGALYIGSSTVHLAHTTIARNLSGGGTGVYVTGDAYSGYAETVMTNTILVSNTVGITVTANNTATLDGVLWFGNGANTGGAGMIAVTNARTGDPALASDGYHLTALSAAFDAGVEAEVSTDIDGDHRPQGAAPDLGADEVIAVYAAPGIETTLVYTDHQGLMTTIRIPPGAVAQATWLTFAPVQSVLPPYGFTFAGHAFDLGGFQDHIWLPGLALGRPATVTLHYSDRDTRLVSDENRLFLGWWTGDEWADAASTCGLNGAAYFRDLTNNTLETPLCHLSRFGLFGPTRPMYLPVIARVARGVQ